MSSVNSTKVLSNIYSLDNIFKTFRKKIRTASYEPGSLGRVMMNSSKDYELSEEKTFAVSDCCDDGIKEKFGSFLYECSAHSLNQEVKKSSDQTIQEDNDSLNSSYRREQSPESLELDRMTIEDEVNGGPEALTPTSSQPHDASFSSLNQDQQYLISQTRMESNSTETSNDPSSISKSKVAEQLVKFCYSEKDDQVKILQELDELKFEVQRLFTTTADGSQSSEFSIKVTHFKGKIPSEKHPPLLGEARNSSYGGSRPWQETQILQSKHERPQTAKCHCRPFSGGAPFVICCRCYKLLQLPADFLVSAEKIQKLRCGGCSEVLKYTFRPRTQSTHQTTALKR
ncbi:hypothetical protein KSP39_PZI017647 [Platanthera zijinensis]|uniref:Probable zinc-ribbon domain-containing protein n=1 Tax=Platanthera zijinensis TaxID=2320716 RepID=A0AAP0G049_9ASPA